MRKIIYIDFHGTLCYKSYSETLQEVLDEEYPSNVVSSSNFRDILDSSYFWDTPQKDHLHLNTAKKWWAVMLNKIENAYSELGYRERSEELAQIFKRKYTDPKQYSTYEDTIEGLKALKKMGCRIHVLSNHVPELKKIVKKMPMGKYINKVFTSGRIGYEKPNQNFYKHVLKRTCHPRNCIMIGDNILADIQGAEKAGIPAILVRNSLLKKKSKYFAKDIVEAAGIVAEMYAK